MELEKTPESPLDSKEIKPVNLKEIKPAKPLEGLMLKLKLQYFGHLMQTAELFIGKAFLLDSEKAMATHSSTLT